MAFAWLIPLAIVLVGTLIMLQPRVGVKHPVTLSSAKLLNLFEKAQSRPLAERIAFWSERLMKDPTLLAPLGRGPEITDTAPLFPKRYDCTTFVETVSALARSRSSVQLADKLISVRYRDGQVSFATRNHFPEADWIPNNEAADLLRDITLEVARDSGLVASFARKDIDKISWFRSQGAVGRAVASTAEAEPVSVQLPYIRIDSVGDAVAHIPQGAVLNVVRENRASKPVLISHQGFLVKRDGKAYFRHAGHHQTITEAPFESYVAALRAKTWKVVGFNVTQFRD